MLSALLLQPLARQAGPPASLTAEVPWAPPEAAWSPTANKRGGWACFDGETLNFLIYESLIFINCSTLLGLTHDLGKSLSLWFSMPRLPRKQRWSGATCLEKSLLTKWLEEVMAFITIVITLCWCLPWPDPGLVLYMSSNPQSNPMGWVSLPPFCRWINQGLANVCNLSSVTQVDSAGARPILRSPDSRTRYWGTHCLIFSELEGAYSSPLQPSWGLGTFS